jgi:hypothetical protein
LDRILEQLYIDRLYQVLARMGHIYTPADLIDSVNRGDMQCFVDNDSFGLTEIVQYPRRRVLDIPCVVGNLDSSLRIHDQILEFAKDNKVTFMRAQARPGWWPYAKKLGWERVNVVYHKEL